MSLPRSFLRILILAAALFLLASAARAQITEVNNNTATPIQGTGHDYIKMLNETVNPANGSISLRIQVAVPPGRQLTLPFSFNYDSGGAYTAQGNELPPGFAHGIIRHPKLLT